MMDQWPKLGMVRCPLVSGPSAWFIVAWGFLVEAHVGPHWLCQELDARGEMVIRAYVAHLCTDHTPYHDVGLIQRWGEVFQLWIENQPVFMPPKCSGNAVHAVHAVRARRSSFSR